MPVLALLCLSQLASEPELRPTRWAVKDVISAAPSAPGWELAWSPFWPLGTPSGDDRHSFFGHANEWDGLTGFAERRFWHQFGREEPRVLRWDQRSTQYARFPFANSYTAPLLALLKAPDGIRATILDITLAPSITVRDWTTGTLRGIFDVPPPPNPNWPPLGAFRALRTAGDVDGDGYDDILFETNGGGASVVGVMDGRTLQPRWLHGEYPMAIPTAAVFVSQGGPFDVNGDGWLDQIHHASLFDLVNGGYVQVVSLLSGVDGSEIWRHQTGPWTDYCGAAWGGDFDGDQAQDVIVTPHDRDWVAYSGATGAELWRIPLGAREQHYSPGFLGEGQSLVGQTIQPSRHGSGPTAFLPVEVPYPGFRGFRWPVMEVRCATGELVGPAEFPEDLLPWSADRLNAKSMRVGIPITAVGDLDRDGLIEIAHKVYASAQDLPVIGVPLQAAILSPATLTMPEQSPASGELIGELWIPNGAGLSFRLLGSTAFDGAGGERVDGWKTHLGPSPLLTATLAQPAFRGTLDAAGAARIRVDLTRWPLAPGQTVTWKAVVLRAGGAGEVHTLSTLAQTEILP